MISICNNNIWTAGDGPLNGPLSFGGFVLPVELLYFEAKAESNDRCSFQWETATETNNDYFTLYAKTEDQNWKVIAKVDGAGFSNSPETYSIETNVQSGEDALFKLEQTDFNGNRETIGYAKPMRSVTAETKTVVWPNPTRDGVSMDASWASGELRVSVYHIDGSLAFQDKMEMNSNPIVGVNLSAHNLESGTYFIRLDDERQQRSARVTYLQ